MGEASWFEWKGWRVAAVFIAATALLFFVAMSLKSSDQHVEPTYHGLFRGARVTLTRLEPPFVIEFSSKDEMVTAEKYCTHRVIYVSEEQRVIGLRSTDGLNHEIVISFDWIAAVVDTDPRIPWPSWAGKK